MADIASLGIAVDSRQVKAASGALEGLSKSGKTAEQSLKGATRETEKLSGATRTLANAARQAATVLGIGFGVSQIVSMVDQYTKLTAQLRLASTGAGDFARSMDAVNRISRTAQSSLEQTAVLYARISNATRGFGIESSKVAAITESVALGLKVSGASAAESASAILQLSQAFGSGVLRGEEFNAVNEAGPRIMQALAEGMGKTRGELRGLAQDGQITTEVMARVFSDPKLLRDLREQAAQTQTLAGSFTVLHNSLLQLVGVQAQESGAVNVLTRSIQVLADNLDVVIALIATIVAAKLAGWAVLVATSMQQAAVGVGALGAAMTFLAKNPIVALITAIGLAVTAWMAFGRESKAANGIAKESVIESTDAMIAALDKQIDKHQQVIALRKEGMTVEQANRNQPFINQIELLGKEIALINDLKGEYAGLDRAKQDKARAEVLARIVDLTAAQRKEEELSAKAVAITQSEARIKFMEEFATKQEKMTAKIAEARKMLGAAFTAEDEARIRKAFEETNKGANAAASAAKKQANEYATLTAQIRTQTEEYRTALSVGEELTDAQEIRIKLEQDLAAGRVHLTEVQRAGIEADLQSLDAAQAAAIAAEEVAQAYKDKLDAMQQLAKSANQEAAQQELLAATFGMTKTAIAELEVARLMEQRTQMMGVTTTTPAEIAAMNDLIAAKERYAQALGAVESKTLGEEAAKKAAEEWEKASEQINESLTDALLRGFESGKGFAKNLRDTVINMFKTMILRPVISAVLSPISGAVAVGGASGAALAGDGSGGIGVASTLYNTYKAITSGFSGLSSAVTGAIEKVGWQMFSSANDLISGIGNSVINSASAVGSAAGYAAGVGAGVTIGNMISGQFGSSITTMIGTAAGAIIGGPIGAALGGALGGVVNRLFGMGEKKVKSQGIVGTFEDDVFEGQAYTKWKQKGGLFRKSKSGTDYSPLDEATLTMLTDAFLQIKGASMIAAASLGLTSDAIINYSKDIKIQLTKDAEKNKEVLTAMLLGIADEMATQVAPGIEAFAKEGETASVTLSRLSTSLVATNALMDSLGHSLFEVSIAGANSAILLIDAFGGLEKMTAALSSYFDNFYTGAEKRAATIGDITAALNAAGLNVTEDYIGAATRENFRALVDAQDLTTESGRQAYVALINVSEAFAGITLSTDELAAQTAELNAQIDEWRDRINVLSGTTTQQAIDRADELASASTDAERELMQLVYGLEDMGEAVAAANDAVYSAQSGLEESYRAEASALQAIIDAGTAAAQELAQAQSEIASAAYAAELEALQETIDAGTAAAQELAQAHSDLVDEYESEVSALEDVIGQFENFRVSLLEFRDSLLVGGLTTRSPEEQYRAQKALFASTAAAAAAGDVTALGNLQEVAQNFLTASQDYNASTAAYVADFNAVQAALTAAAGAAGGQVDVAQAQLDATQAVQAAIETAALEQAVAAGKAAQAQFDAITSAQASIDAAAAAARTAALEQAVADGQAAQAQLDALNESVNGLITINESVLSVANAIAVLQDALITQAQATDALNAANASAASTAATIPAITTIDAPQATVTAAYAAIGRTGFGEAGNQIDQAGYDYWVNQLTTGAISSGGFQEAFLTAVANYVGDPRYQPSVDIARALLAAGTDLPGFANGGMASGWAMVGERGPELVNFTSPGRVYTAPQTRAALSGDESGPLLRQVLTELRALVRQNGAVGTATVDRLDKVATKLDAQRREISRAA